MRQDMLEEKIEKDLEELRFLSSEELQAVRVELRRHEYRHSEDPNDPAAYRNLLRCDSKLVALYAMQNLISDNMGVEHIHDPLYQSAHAKIVQHLPQLFQEATMDPRVVASMSHMDRVMLHLLYEVPKERLELINKYNQN